MRDIAFPLMAGLAAVIIGLAIDIVGHAIADRKHPVIPDGERR